MTPGFRVAWFFAALFAAAAINTAFLPLWFSDRGLSAAAIGQVLGIAALFRVLAGPGWGTLADRVGCRRPVMLAAAAAASIAALLYLPAHGFLPLCWWPQRRGSPAPRSMPLIDSLALSLARQRRMQYGPVRAVGSVAYMAASAARRLAALGAPAPGWCRGCWPPATARPPSPHRSCRRPRPPPRHRAPSPAFACSQRRPFRFIVLHAR